MSKDIIEQRNKEAKAIQKIGKELAFETLNNIFECVEDAMENDELTHELSVEYLLSEVIKNLTLELSYHLCDDFTEVDEEEMECDKNAEAV